LDEVQVLSLVVVESHDAASLWTIGARSTSTALVPDAVATLGGPAVDGGTRWEIIGQVTPLTAGAGLKEDRADLMAPHELTADTRSRRRRFRERLQQRPLLIGQIRRV
jgi:hypothetical protein